MRTLTCFLPFVFVLMAAAASPVHAHDVDPYHDGWITHVNDHQLEICYRHAPPPVVGETVQILRPSYITLKQGPVLQRFTRSGTARVTAAASGDCVSAELLNGSAERSDHTREASGGAATPVSRN